MDVMSTIVQRFKLVFTGDVFTLVDDARATPADYVAIEEAVRRYAITRGTKLGAIVVVPRDAAVPSPELRKAIASTLANLGPHLVAGAHVVEEVGFKGAVVRGVLTGFQLFRRVSYPTAVFADVRSALRWLKPFVERSGAPNGSVTELLTSIQTGRQGGR